MRHSISQSIFHIALALKVSSGLQSTSSAARYSNGARRWQPHLELVQGCDACRELRDAIVAGQREVGDVDQVQHALGELWQAPLDLVDAA